MRSAAPRRGEKLRSAAPRRGEKSQNLLRNRVDLTGSAPYPDAAIPPKSGNSASGENETMKRLLTLALVFGASVAVAA